MMKKENLNLEFLPQYNAFGISDRVVEKTTKEGCLPLISLKKEDYEKLGCNLPKENAPTIAFLLGREEGHYTIDFNYAKAIAQSNVNIIFLTYGENVMQMENADGLILPGGSFDSPDEFYTDPLKKTNNKPGDRSYAYVTSILQAKKANMPILGICAGAQIVGGMHKMKMLRNVKEYVNTSIEHKTKNSEAHEISIIPDSPLYELLGEKKLVVNSRHNEAMVPDTSGSDLKIYACGKDGVPEAWGNEDEKVLCVQWHPENFASKGDKTMQKIYNWVAGRARIYQKQKELRKMLQKNKKLLLKQVEKQR